MKNNFKLLFALLMAVFMGIVSCQRDDSHLSKNFAAGSSWEITLNQLKAMPKAYRKLEAVMHRQQRKTANDSLWKFDINTDHILYYTDGTHESLTFTVYPEKRRDYVENLVLNREADGSYSVYYTIYNLNDTDIASVKAGTYTDIDGKWYICPFTGVDTSGLLKSAGEPEIIYYRGRCYRKHVYRTTTVYNSVGQRDHSMFEMGYIEVDCPDTFLGSPNGPGYNPGGGTPNNPVFNTPGSNSPGTPPAVPPGGGTGGPYQEIEPVITKPYIALMNTKGCNKIEAIMAAGTYRQDIANMAAKVNDVVNEHGVALLLDNTTIEFTPGPNININGDGLVKYKAFNHLHNDPPNGGTYSIFSYEDLRDGILKLLKGNRIDPTVFIATLSTKKGTHYALTIEDVEKFKKFFYHRLNSYAILQGADQIKYSQAAEKEKKIKTKYFDIKTGLIKIQNVNNELILGLFLNFMQEADLGIHLYETDAAFQEFTHVRKAKSSLTDYTIERLPCTKKQD